MIEETGCDAIMIGRAARGNPWLFKSVIHFLETGEHLPEPTVEDVKKMILRHAKLQLEYKGEYIGIREMRKHVAWYTAGYPHSSSIRNMVNGVTSYDELQNLIERL